MERYKDRSREVALNIAHGILSSANTAELTLQEINIRLRDPNISDTEKLQLAINLVGKAVPGIENTIAKVVFGRASFPVKEKFTKANAYGGENIVFFLNNNQQQDEPTHVLKVDHVSIGLSRDQIMNRAGIVTGEHKILDELYKDIDGLIIPEEQVIVLNSHIFGLPTIGTIQKYVPGVKMGVFEDFTDKELIDYLSMDARLKKTI